VILSLSHHEILSLSHHVIVTISPCDIVTINKLTVILKIIGQYEAKHTMMLPIKNKTITFVLKVWTYNIICITSHPI